MVYKYTFSFMHEKIVNKCQKQMLPKHRNYTLTLILPTTYCIFATIRCTGVQGAVSKNCCKCIFFLHKTHWTIRRNIFQLQTEQFALKEQKSTLYQLGGNRNREKTLRKLSLQRQAWRKNKFLFSNNCLIVHYIIQCSNKLIAYMPFC